jgi:adsorption protein B
VIAGFSPSEWLALVEHELLLFAGAFFLVGALDELVVDLVWLWVKLTGRANCARVDTAQLSESPLAGPAAIFIPTWREARVIGATIRHALTAWPQEDLRLYVGCYCNDSETIEAVVAAAQGDSRLRLVIHDREGPTTKADCLNRLNLALREDEEREGAMARMVVMHDAEDMVDPAALPLLDRALDKAEFVQLPVLPIPQAASPWIGSHYCEEFAEAHGKAMVVRCALRAGLPSAGVGCAIARPLLLALAERHPAKQPFATDSLTEDYELGLGVSELGGRSHFVRARSEGGRLIATRAYFPATLESSVRQKTRWIHGIALQGWDRLGWGRNPADVWMRLRDRRGPLAALVLATAYLLLILVAVSWLASFAGYGMPAPVDPTITLLLAANLASFVWRALWRFGFTAREYGVIEGARAVLRIPVGNIIAIMSGRRALAAYVGTLRGNALYWDKTEHEMHPSLATRRELAA